MKEMEQQHEAIKAKILKIVDEELEPLERAYEEAGKILNNRLNPNKNDELPKGDMFYKKY